VARGGVDLHPARAGVAVGGRERREDEREDLVRQVLDVVPGERSAAAVDPSTGATCCGATGRRGWIWNARRESGPCYGTPGQAEEEVAIRDARGVDAGGFADLGGTGGVGREGEREMCPWAISNYVLVIKCLTHLIKFLCAK
jgi:hypothetical protein